MRDIRKELVGFGVRIARAGLVAGAGGNISARDGKIIWMKPSGFAMDEMGPGDLCGLDLETGMQKAGNNKPTSEFNMHLAVYRMRPEINAVFHTHSPWASGVVSSGIKLRPMFAEFAGVLGRTTTIPYVTPTTIYLADAMAGATEKHDTVFMVNHGVLAVGLNMKQAYSRCLLAEQAAIALTAAAAVGKPKFLTAGQQAELKERQKEQRHIGTK